MDHHDPQLDAMRESSCEALKQIGCVSEELVEGVCRIRQSRIFELVEVEGLVLPVGVEEGSQLHSETVVELGVSDLQDRFQTRKHRIETIEND
jgi:hypothetical protein